MVAGGRLDDQRRQSVLPGHTRQFPRQRGGHHGRGLGDDRSLADITDSAPTGLPPQDLGSARNAPALSQVNAQRPPASRLFIAGPGAGLLKLAERAVFDKPVPFGVVHIGS